MFQHLCLTYTCGSPIYTLNLKKMYLSGRERERENSYMLVDLQNCESEAKSGPQPGTGNSVQAGTQVFESLPVPLGHGLRGSWAQDLELGVKLRHSDVGWKYLNQ